MTFQTSDGLPTVKDSLGCSTGQLARSEVFRSPQVALFRKTNLLAEPCRIETPASARGLLIGLSLADGHRRLIHRGRRAERCVFAANSIYVRGFGETYRADVESPFDFLLVELPPDRDDDGSHAAHARDCENWIDVQGVPDPVLPHLGRALMPALAAPQEACTLFVDQVCLAMRSHVLETYAGGRRTAPPRRRLLSRWQERRAKELLSETLSGAIAVADVAAACGLSRAHFIRAFAETVGTTPYQWLLRQRVARARSLLLTPMPLADVAITCSFADQSHFTRVFSRLAGVAPAAWRRMQ